jgi:hypothetical protein
MMPVRTTVLRICLIASAAVTVRPLARSQVMARARQPSPSKIGSATVRTSGAVAACVTASATALVNSTA